MWQGRVGRGPQWGGLLPWESRAAFSPPEFNVGQYRRDMVKTYRSFEFFLPDNEEGLRIRK